MLGASLVPRERDVFLSRWPTHWLVQGADSANHVQKQTTRYPYMVTRQRKTGHVNVVYVLFAVRSCPMKQWLQVS